MTAIDRSWKWVPSLFFTEGFPYIIINVVSVIMYKRLDVSNAEIGLYTSWLYLPWVLKPLWSPLVEVNGAKRNWFLVMQLLGGFSLMGVGLSLHLSAFLTVSLIFLWIAAIWSATHDIAADGYYMIVLTEKAQSFFIGIRSTFYRLGVVAGQGLIVILAGIWETSTGNNVIAWRWTFFVCAATMLILAVYHFYSTPKVVETNSIKPGWRSVREVFVSFFAKENIGFALAFILLYRLGESQLVKMASPFLLDSTAEGGLGLTTTEVGTIYGTIGWIMLSVGGILGGIVISRDGLGKWMLPMAFALNIPNVLYVLLSVFQPSAGWVSAAVIIEQFGYGFGFTSFLMYTIYIADGPAKTTHYALATGFMALGMMVPGMISGYVQELLGYTGFFLWVAMAGVPAFFLIRKLNFPYDYGKK